MQAWKKNIRQVEPYVPGEQPELSDMIKLNTNENPYPPAPGVLVKLREMDTDRFRRYPDPAASELTRCLAQYYKVRPEQVFVGVGSDDVLAMAFLTFFNSKLPILFPDITYSFYPVWAELFHIPYQTPALDSEFRIAANDYSIPNGGIVIANPNAPTSIAEELDWVEEIVCNNQESVVIIDEAYVDFGANSALPLVEKYDNLLVVQTFSKSRSMAGMRIGYAIGSDTLIEALQQVKYSFNSYTMNQTSLCLGVAAVKEDTYFKQCIGKIIATRERAKQELRELGFLFPDSKTNFLFLTHPLLPAQELYEALRKEHIFVRYFQKERIDQYLRVTIGTDQEMNQFLDFLKKYIRKHLVFTKQEG